MIREDVRNLLEQSAQQLDRVPRGRNPYAAMYAFALRELGENLERLAAHPEMLPSFLAHYCLAADAAAAPERKAA